MKIYRIIILVFSVLWVFNGSLFAQTVAKEIVHFEQIGENLLRPDGFRAYQSGYVEQDGVYVCDNGTDEKSHRGVSQHVVLNQDTPQPIYAEAWSKAENVGGHDDADYSLYLDLVHADGTNLWGQIAPFSTGSHDWQRRSVVVFPEKPVKSLSFYTLLRNKNGKASFRDLKLAVFNDDTDTARFDGRLVRLHTVEQEAVSVQIRDVAADSDYYLLGGDGSTGLEGIKARVETVPFDGPAFPGTTTTIELENTTGADRCLSLVFARNLSKLDAPAWCAPRKTIPVSERRNREHYGPFATWQIENIGSNGRMSKYPFSGVVGSRSGQSVGHGVGLDFAYPAFFRTGYNEASGELFIVVDLALTKESPKTMLRFVGLDFEAKHGFRGLVNAYQHRFPDFFRCRTPKQGVWMPFAPISKVAGFEDFGFRFKEGCDETAWDDKHDILTFRYMEPMTYWMPMPKDMPRTYEAALAELNRLATGGNEWAKAILVGGMRDADGRLGHKLLDTPWCDGVVWSPCDLPGVEGGGFQLKWSERIAEKMYGEEAAKNGVLDGEYIDSSEGYVTSALNFDRKHFSAVTTPLVFSRHDFRPAIFRGLNAYEYTRAFSEAVHGRGKLLMANSTPISLCWLAPYLDVMGMETDWNRNGRWSPASDDELIHVRILCGPKPYCFLMNTDFTRWTFALSEKFMKRSLAYGMFPGFFSENASTKQYFTNPELYERDRPLFKKYIPLCKEVAQAGWQPVPLASTSDENVYIERFGGKDDPGRSIYTVLNDSRESRTVTLVFDEPPTSGRFVERLSGKELEIKNNVVELTIMPEDVLVLTASSFQNDDAK